MSIHKITPFFSDIKTFFKNSDMTAAMQNISSVLSRVRMTERDTLAVLSKHNCVYRLLTVFHYLLLFPCFGIRNAYRNQKYGTFEPLVRTRKNVFYRFMENPEIDWRRALWHISVQLWNQIRLRSDHKPEDVWTAPVLVRLGKRLKLQKYSRKLKCNYIMYDAVFGEVKVRIFLVPRTQHGKWYGLLTTGHRHCFPQSMADLLPTLDTRKHSVNHVANFVN